MLIFIYYISHPKNDRLFKVKGELRMKIERVYLKESNDIESTLESILFDLLDNYIIEKYNLNKINNATSSIQRKEMY